MWPGLLSLWSDLSAAIKQIYCHFCYPQSMDALIVVNDSMAVLS